MQYDRELQKAGKLFVSATQGENGKNMRARLKAMKEQPLTCLMLVVEWSDGQLVASVGDGFKVGGRWGFVANSDKADRAPLDDREPIVQNANT